MKPTASSQQTNDENIEPSAPKYITVAIIEDDPIVRVGLATVIEQDTRFKIVALAGSLEEFQSSQTPKPRVVILDLHLRGGGVDGVAAVKKLRRNDHNVLIISMSDEEVPVVEAIGAGAAGYLTKEAEPKEIVRAIQTVSVGESYISATVAGYLLNNRARLTEREKEVLRLLASGETTADIAKRLFLTVSGVNGHLDRIRDKTGRRRRADLTRFALESGIIRSRRG